MARELNILKYPDTLITFIFKTYIEHFHEVLGENIQYVFHIQALSNLIKE